jgi:hypothetical protein
MNSGDDSLYEERPTPFMVPIRSMIEIVMAGIEIRGAIEIASLSCSCGIITFSASDDSEQERDALKDRWPETKL